MSAPARSAVFYSAIRGVWDWGAPDYVWPLAAQRLLAQGVRVTAVLHRDALARAEVRDLAARGAAIHPQPPVVLAHGAASRLRHVLITCHPARHRLLSHLRGLDQPHVFVNQGGAFDLGREDALRQWLAASGATYDLFFRSNQPRAPLPSPMRDDALRLLLGAQRCLFNSRWTRELTEEQVLTRLPNAAIFPHLIRFPYEQPLPWPAPDSGDTARLAVISRMDAYHKGLDVLLKALAVLPSSLPPWTIDFYGRGVDAAYLEKLAGWLGLDHRVRFHPHADDVAGIWKTHHLLVLTSRYEGLSVSMLEAMACGRPVLRTPYGGCAEWLVPDETGYVCEAPEPALIAASLARAIQDRARWPVMGRAAHARIWCQLPRDPWRLYLEPFGLG